MAAGSIVIDLLMRTGSFETDTGRAEKALAKLKKEAHASGLAIGQAFRGIVASAGASLGVIGFASMIKRAIDGVDALNDLKDATGASIEKLSALEDIAARTGTGIEKAGDALIKLNKALAEASKDSNSDAARAIEAIGLRVADLLKLDPVEAMQQVGRALNSFADNGAKGRISLELLGRSTKELAQLFKELGDAGELVGTVTAKDAEEAEKFNKELMSLGKTVTDITRDIAGPMVAGINALIEKFREGAKEGRGFWQVLAGESEILRMSLSRDLREQLGLIPRQGSSGSWGNTGGATGAWDAQKPSLPDVLKPRRASRGAAAGDKTTDAQRDLAAYVKALDSQVQKLDELSEHQKALNFLQTLGTTGQIPQVRAVVLGLAQQADAMRDIKAQEEDIIALRKLEAAAVRDLDEEIDRLSGRADDRRKAALTARLEAILSSGVKFSEEELHKIVRGIAGINEELKNTRTLADDLGDAFAGAFEDAIVNGGRLSDVIKGLEKDILRLITRELVTEPLAKALGGIFKDSGIGSGIGNFFGGLFGGRAAGGPVSAGGLYQVNERGRPEMLRLDGKEFLLMGNRRGWVDPSPSTNTGRASTINAPITINMPGGASAASASQVGAMVARRLQLAAARNS